MNFGAICACAVYSGCGSIGLSSPLMTFLESPLFEVMLGGRKMILILVYMPRSVPVDGILGLHYPLKAQYCDLWISTSNSI